MMKRSHNHLTKVFQSYPSNIKSWLGAKGFNGEFSDALTNYFKSKSGLTSNATLFDHINTTVNAFGYSGTLGDQMRRFFTVKTGLENPVDAENAFWANSSLDFSLLAPITLVAHTVAFGSNAAVTTSAINTTGASLIVLAISVNNGTTPTVTDSAGNTWTALTSQTATGLAKIAFYYKASPTTSATHTFTNTGTFPTIGVMAFNNTLGVAPFDVENGAMTASGTTRSTGSVSPSLDNEVIVTALAGTPTGGGVSIDSGFNLVDQQDFVGSTAYSMATAYKVQTAKAAVNPTWSFGGTFGAAAVIATFKNAS